MAYFVKAQVDEPKAPTGMPSCWFTRPTLCKIYQNLANGFHFCANAEVSSRYLDDNSH